MSNSGIVYLIGAGPGDIGLITVKALSCLKKADVVVYDYLANEELLSYAPETAERIYVGKKAGQHTMQQEDISQLLADKAGAGNVVARLKGGDPFIFGRGAEEALVLKKNDIRFEIVPGITAGIACPAYAGIPATYREFNSNLTFVTGHEDPNKETSAINWDGLASVGGTLVFYMGVKNLKNIAQRLIDAGLSPDTGAALIEHGTKPRQRVVTGTLADIKQKADDAEIRPPAITLVGQVATLRDQLAWFESRPLFGKRIVVTRTRTQASGVKMMLEDLGAEVITLPTIRIEPPKDNQPLADAVNSIEKFDWIVFTSVNGVNGFFKTIDECGRDTRVLAGRRICAVGSVTAERLQSFGVKPDLIPDTYSARSVCEALEEAGEVSGKSFLLPRADIAPEEMPKQLAAAGGIVSDIIAYRTVPETPSDEVRAAFAEGDIDIVTFSSSSTAKNFATLARNTLGGLPDGPAYASIGPETSRAAAEEGMEIAIEAEVHTIKGLVDAVAENFGGRS